MTADRERSERDPMEAQQFAGLRELGYPQSPGGCGCPWPGLANCCCQEPDPPDVIVARQARLSAAFAEILAYQPSVTPIVCPGAVPVADDDLDEWIAAEPAERKHLHREVARSLCYLEAFKR